MGITHADNIRRSKDFEIVALYVLSKEDMNPVEATQQNLLDLWLTTFTNSLKGIIGSIFNSTKLIAWQFFQAMKEFLVTEYEKRSPSGTADGRVDTE